MAQDWDTLLDKLKSTKSRPDGVSNREWGKVLKTLDSLTERKEKHFDPVQHKAKTQSDLAKMFIRYYFGFLAGLLVFTLAYNVIMKRLKINDYLSVKDSFVMASSTITPILAFVLGHYFKGKD